MPKLVTLNVNGEPTVVEINKAPDYTELQAIVGGNIEVVPYFDSYKGEPCVAFCNEEGKLHALPLNENACRAWIKSCVKYGLNPIDKDYLVGPIALCVGDQDFLDTL